MESSTIDFPFSLTDYRYSADVIPFEGILTRFNFTGGAEQYNQFPHQNCTVHHHLFDVENAKCPCDARDSIFVN